MKEHNVEPSHDEIARRAHEISQRPDAGASDEENWFRAERELRAEAEVASPPTTTRRRNVASRK